MDFIIIVGYNIVNIKKIIIVVIVEKSFEYVFSFDMIYKHMLLKQVVKHIVQNVQKQVDYK